MALTGRPESFTWFFSSPQTALYLTMSKLYRFFHLIFMTGCCIRPYNWAPRCKTKKGGTGEICFFCYQKDSCVRMVRQSNITQIYKKKKYVFKQYDGLVTCWICVGNMNVRVESEFGVWWSKFWLVRQDAWTNRIKHTHSLTSSLIVIVEKHLGPLRHLVKVIWRHEMTNKKTMRTMRPMMTMVTI